MKYKLSALLVVLAFVVASVATPSVAKASIIYTGDSSGSLWTTDSGTGASTLVGSMGSVEFDIAFDNSGNLFGVAGGSTLHSINASTAVTTSIGSTGATINGLDFDASGTLFGSGGNSLYTINTSNGLATVVGSGNMGFSSAGDLAFAPDGTLFLSAIGNNLVKLNPITGVGTLVGSLGFSDVYGIDFVGSTLFGTTLTGQLITINTATGAGTLVANTSPNVASFGSSVNNAIPEPTTLAIWSLLGGIGLVVGHRRRRRKAA